ncbi:HAD family hydrolase [Zavarzinella formosa]|uniref:HAD family hydrolase n=1 Tax=Zavarzinella formosa TaxID=360055 RepID=UPI000313BC8A|nr:HAD-IA family hydrolase [Zavarzinella formosa]
MPKFRAVLFDFDGTLADSYMAITASVNHTLTHYGRPALTEPQVRGMVGHGLQQLMEVVLPDIDPIEAAAVYRSHHPEVMITHTRVLPGVAEGLAKLSALGIKMGICSNKPSKFTREIAKGISLSPYFTIVLGPDDVVSPKPDPAMIHAALQALETPVESALYVGDMEVDVETGRRAKIETWVMPTGSNDVATLQAANAQKILPNFDEVIARFLET